MPKDEGGRITREAILARVTEEIELPNGYHRLLTQLVETKQREVLLRFFYVPFWKACSATLALLAVILFLSGALALTLGLAAVCGFSTYMVSRSSNQLKRIKELLAGAEAVETPLGGTTLEETITPPRSPDKRKEKT